MVEDLVFDIGANNGDDVAHYLARGFRVVAVEAAPVWVRHLDNRFRAEIRAGRVVILDCAIAREEGPVTFYVSEGNRGVWSSLDADRAGREGTQTRQIVAAGRTLASLMQQFGVPYFLKIDIEGADRICLESIDPEDAPAFVSFEASESELAELYYLYEKGYRRFRLVDQTTFARVPIPRLHSAASLVEATRHWIRQRVRGRRLPPPPPSAQPQTAFTISSSGPMPHELDAPWSEVDDVALAWLYYVRGAGSGRWFDVHASR